MSKLKRKAKKRKFTPRPVQLEEVGPGKWRPVKKHKLEEVRPGVWAPKVN